MLALTANTNPFWSSKSNTIGERGQRGLLQQWIIGYKLRDHISSMQTTGLWTIVWVRERLYERRSRSRVAAAQILSERTSITFLLFTISVNQVMCLLNLSQFRELKCIQTNHFWKFTFGLFYVPEPICNRIRETPLSLQWKRQEPAEIAGRW